MKRFWKEVAVERAPDDLGAGWRVVLDGRPIKTQGGNQQIVPTRALAELLASEWSGQGEEIDTSAFAGRDMTDYAIDLVAHDRPATIAKLLRYVETDTLCYRADPDEPLHRRQWAVWEPIISQFEAREGVKLERVSGVLHKPQSPSTLATLRARLERLDPFSLAALETMASLSASLTVALLALEKDADIDALWAAAELEELWQVELWGSDWEAEERRERRKTAFRQAAAFGSAARD